MSARSEEPLDLTVNKPLLDDDNKIVQEALAAAALISLERGEFIAASVGVLFDECMNDALFFVAIVCIGLSFNNVAWIPAIVHGATSTVSALAVTLAPSKRIARCRVSVCVSTCITVAALADSLCIAQLVCRSLDEDEGQPVFFSIGAQTHHPIALTILISAHATSFVAAVYRLRRTSLDLGAHSSFTALGATLGASFVYLVWIADGGGLAGRVFHTHFYVGVAFVILSLVDVITAFGTPHRSVWWIAAVVLVVQYVVLVSNISVLFGDLAFAEGISSALTHHFDRRFAKAQAAWISTVLVCSNAYKTVTMAPKTVYISELTSFVARTPAVNSAVEPFAAFVICMVNFAFTTFPTLCGAVALFGNDAPQLSRFVLLMYVSLLSLRFWIQSNAAQVWLFVLVSVLGVVLDGVVFINILYFGKNVATTNRGEAETAIILTASLGSTIVSLICLMYSATQDALMRKHAHHKTM
jgi:hypothetical protein